MSEYTSRDFARAEHYEFYKALRSVDPSGSFRLWNLFDDWLQLAWATMYQPVHKLLTGKIDDRIEAEYLRTIGKYKKGNPNGFAEGLGIMTDSLTNDIHDFLGDVAQCTGVTSHWGGQYFTPRPLCEMMVRMQMPEKMPEHRLTVCEPCVGGGAFLLAIVNDFKERNIGPWQWWFDATDIDVRCARMAYIQLTLCGAPGVVRHGDSLWPQEKTWGSWLTLAGVMFPHFPKPEDKRISLAQQRREQLKAL